MNFTFAPKESNLMEFNAADIMSLKTVIYLPFDIKEDAGQLRKQNWLQKCSNNASVKQAAINSSSQDFSQIIDFA